MKVKLANVRLAFPDLFEATQVNGQGDHKFRATFLLTPDHPANKDIEAAIKKVAADKWGTKAEAVLKTIVGNPMRYNYRSGDEKAEYDGYPGNMYIAASNKARPLVLDRDKSPLTAADGRPYSGCFVNATITIFAYDNQGKGISASLGGVQFFKDGDAFAGGGIASEDDFDEITEGADAESLI
ncbi:TPA: DUF2815 family protein [Yersinia enterocolitica]|uniref:Uncharacterized protein 50 n=1 Tax=Yersinia enterocolitica W22703 TaxID=913028 RepID=F4N2H2_YEREN|nr:DUF2815 family protein [Yersinia enterocolitica]QCW23319.1 hypothetical protein [Yersinia phage YeP4]QCW23546.1 hypothetical protein [Yersinia phage YeP5]QCW23584.1 hypothetical protein [Yersinia phage YeP6]CBX72280.1 putative protein p50 [Yersinia enterocolitica W22703]ADZ41834.1 hypothetical protein YE105_C1338 [Yersinia enterocolitica subsp. palearctica 105.5R(r)]